MNEVSEPPAARAQGSTPNPPRSRAATRPLPRPGSRRGVGLGSALALAGCLLAACGDSDADGTSGGGGPGGGGAGPTSSASTVTQGTGTGQGGDGGAAGCVACANGFACEENADCASRRCDPSGTTPVCAPCLAREDCLDSGDAWDCVEGVCTDSGAKANGLGCDDGEDCASGFCVDDVCCDAACGDATDDCMACSEGAGAQHDGVCGPLASGTSCGDSSEAECDLADTCDGSGACRENLLAAGTACTSDGVFCNGVEACDGAGACVTPGEACTAIQACVEDAEACRLNLWINEIHYDNTDPDVSEGIELAGAAGIDLDGFVIVLVTPDGAIVAGIGPLGGVIADESNGFGTVSFELPGLPEGNFAYAVLDAAGTPVDFISHGGAIVGTVPPLVGLSSLDVGLVEDETTSPTASLQLTGGPGASVSDFNWVSGTNSLGAINAGQSF